MITASYPHQHGIIGPNEPPYDTAWPTYMKNLKAAGYTTASFGKTHYFSEDPEALKKMAAAPKRKDARDLEPFVRSFGFDHSSENPHTLSLADENYNSAYAEYLRDQGLLEIFRRQMREHKGNPQQNEGYLNEFSAEHNISSFIAREVIDWFEKRDQSKPFFAIYAPIQPHPPYGADPKWAAYYADKKIPEGPREQVQVPNPVWGVMLNERYKRFPEGEITRDYVDNSKRMYYASISLVDEKVGEILAALEKRGELDNTWVIWSSDHGDLMGDHGFMDKSLFYHASVGVPGIIRPPRQVPARQVVTTPAEQIDMSATILDIAGAEPLDAPGRSLLPVMNGKETTQYAFAEMSPGKNMVYIGVTDGRYRYTVEHNSKTPCEFFDLQEDPDEVTNLVNDPGYKKRIADMQKNVIEPHITNSIL